MAYIEEGGVGYPFQGKGLDLGAELPRIELCRVPPLEVKPPMSPFHGSFHRAPTQSVCENVYTVFLFYILLRGTVNSEVQIFQNR